MRWAQVTRMLYLAAAAAGSSVRAADTGATVNAEAGDLTALNLETLMNIPIRAASGFEQTSSEAPSFVTILTGNELRSFGYRSLADALSSVAGFYSTYDRMYSFLGVRGFNRPGDYNTRTLVLINGVRVNDPLYSTGRVGLDFPLDLDLVDHIEVVRGPSSSLYGSSAFFAVVNVVTRAAKDVTPAEVATSAGSYDAFSGRLSLARVFGDKGSILVSGSLLNSAGDDLYFPLYDSPATNNGVAKGRDGEKLGSLFVQGHYGDLTLQVVHVDRSKDLPTASYGTIFNDPAGQNRDRETLVDISWAGELAPDWTGLARVGYQRYVYGADWPYDVAPAGAPPDRMVTYDRASSDSIGGEARVTTKALPRNTVTAGVEVRNVFGLDQRYIVAGSNVLDSHETQVDLGFYLQDEIHMAAWAMINTGVRYDRLEPYGDDALSPRTALILKPAESSTLKLIYGEAFRAPNAYERFYDDGTSTKASTGLKPENIRTYEMVWEQQVTARFQLNAALYRNEINNLITQVEDPVDGLLVFRNLDKAEAQGFDVEGIADLRGGFQVRGSYSFCQTKNATTHARLSNAPEHMAKLNLLAPVVPRWLSVGLEVQYLSSRLTVLGEETRDYVVVNATLRTQRLAPNLDLALSVYNLFDTIYSDPVGSEIAGGTVAQDGRTLRLKAVYRF